MWTNYIKQLADQNDNNGVLPSIVFPYPVTYIDNDNSEICATCANHDKEESIFNVVDYYIDDTDCICAECGKYIDPALNGSENDTAV